MIALKIVFVSMAVLMGATTIFIMLTERRRLAVAVVRERKRCLGIVMEVSILSGSLFRETSPTDDIHLIVARIDSDHQPPGHVYLGEEVGR